MKFTEKEDQFILDNYMKLPLKRISAMLGRCESSARQRLHRLGHTVPKELAMKFALESRIKPGTIPPNKGKAMSEELREKIKHTFFTKGHVPHNAKYDGHVSVRKDTSGRPYKYIRISKSKVELMHRHLWEQQYGKIPEGYVVSFKDRNSLNCEIENLELISREENMKRNSVQNLPEEIKTAIRYVAGFNRKINTYVKNNQ